MKKVIFMFLLLMSMLCFAEPSKTDIMNAVSANNFPAAEMMINEVVSNHPKSAKAHYFRSQILAKEEKIPEARSELNAAMTLDPAGSFSDPAHLTAYRAVLDNAVLTKSTVTTTSATTHRDKAIHSKYSGPNGIATIVVLFLMVLIIIAIVWMGYITFSRRSRTDAIYNSNYYPQGTPRVYTDSGTSVHQQSSVGYPPASTTIINGGGSGNGGGTNGLVTGMMLGSMMSHNNGYGGGYNNGYGGHNGGMRDDYIDESSTTTSSVTSATTEKYESPSFAFDSGPSSSSSWDSGPSSSDSSSSYDSGSSGGSDW